eukprot:6600474-Prymnesium_polylepis.1
MPAGRPWHGVHLSRAAVATSHLQFAATPGVPARRRAAIVHRRDCASTLPCLADEVGTALSAPH